MSRVRSDPLEPKGHNFRLQEKIILLDLIAKHGRELIEEHETLTLFRRSHIWQTIHAEYNQHEEFSRRSEKQLRLLWKNTKARCKREFRLNAAQYQQPGYVIDDPVLMRVGALVGFHDDGPTKNSPHALAEGRRTVRQTLMMKRLAKTSHRRLLQGQRSVSASQIQIGRTYSLAGVPRVRQPPRLIAPAPVAHSTSVLQMDFVPAPAAPAPTPARQLGPPVRIYPVGLDPIGASSLQESTLLSSQPSELPPPIPAASHPILPAEEQHQRRRKNAVPRKNTEAINAASTDNDDTITMIEEANDEPEEDTKYNIMFLNSEIGNQTVGDEWSEDGRSGNHTTVSKTLQSPSPSPPLTIIERCHPQQTSDAQDTTDTHPQRVAVQSVKKMGPRNLQCATSSVESTIENMQRPLSTESVNSQISPRLSKPDIDIGADNRGKSTTGTDQQGGRDSIFQPTSNSEEAKVEHSLLSTEMLKMAKKEHELKMATILMKRKQIMQIRRREHLARMERYRLNKELLKLRKRKLELEIRNSMYLEEVEDELDS